MEEKKPEGGRKSKTFFEVAEKRRKLSEERNRTRVVLGETFQRWRAMKEQRGVKTDAQLAKIILDSVRMVYVLDCLFLTPSGGLK
ncbi:hypothetical protein DPX16_5790 [Anabarilius grahami]|uniref:Uncharacterized protein n=1 Tax=Anabarilius grahami TaxID=495550 RepID=A0A3N0YVU9_ANAGA|nr:hypothetical protein DPX16_5790 [Anabarilius grahami]